MEKMTISLEKGRGRNTLTSANRKKASSIPRHHLNMFIMRIPLQQAVEKRSSAALRCKPHRSTYFNIRLALRFLRALHLSIFEQPAKNVFYNTVLILALRAHDPFRPAGV